MRCIVNEDVVLSRPLEGPLSAHIGAFAVSVREQGYAPDTQQRQVMLAACFSRWLGQKAISAQRVCAEHLTQCLRSRARHLRIHRGDAAALRQFLEFLRREGIVPAEKTSSCPLTPVEQTVREFETYLRNERALAETTIAYYVLYPLRFLTDRFGEGRVVLSRLSASDVVRFVQRQVPRLHQKRAKRLTSTLRSFLNYARYRGDITNDLAAAVPCVPAWSMTSIPRAIPIDAVCQLLASIDQRTPAGRRDYAILLLLARLGLRASEIVLLELDDIDWAAGELRVRGKGGQCTALPLSAEVGKAIVSYLRQGRPRSTSRRVFLRIKAPIRGFLDQGAIGSIVRHNIARAGIDSPSKGAHQFRHALAVQMLRHGASLTEIGEVLRHRSPQTTTIYAKVDLEALRPLALPWPGGVR
jgi:site-specific recombinase XerD